jgi:hypothetical protein
VTAPGPDVAALAGRAIQIAEKAAATQKTIVETQEKIVSQQAHARSTSRKLVRVIVADVIISVLLLGLAVVQAREAQQFCQQRNAGRATQVQLWDHILAVEKAAPGETAAEREARLAKLAGFRVYVAKHFMPVSCGGILSNLLGTQG